MIIKSIACIVSTSIIFSSVTYAQSIQYVTHSEVNQPNGVAGLDSTGNVTAPIRSTNGIFSTTLRVSPDDLQGGATSQFVEGPQPAGHVAAFGLYATAGYGNSLMEIMNGTKPSLTLDSSGTLSIGKNLNSPGAQQFGMTPAGNVLPSDAGSSSTNYQLEQPIISANFLWNNDSNENPNTFMIGGHAPWQGGAMAIYGAPYTYGNDGALMDIEMTNGLWAYSRAGSGDFDAISQFIEAGNTTPYYKIGLDFTDDQNVKHALTFDANGLTVTPALPQSFFTMWNAHGKGGGSGMLIVTNMNANTPGSRPAIPGFPAQTMPDLWSGYITGVTPSSDGTSTHLDMPAGWHPSSGWVGAYGANNHAVPDNSKGLDQVFYSAYSNPLVVIGTYMQAFAQNMKCGLSYDSATNYQPGSTITRNDAPTQSCQANEADFYVPTSKPDGWMHAQGFTADLLNSSPLVSPDSAAFIAQGNWPVAYTTGLGADGRDFQGGVLDVNSRRGPTSTIGATTEMMEVTQGGDAPTDVRSNMQGIRITQMTDTVGYENSAGYHNPEDNSVHIGAWRGGSQFGVEGTSLGHYGEFKGDLVFNPGWRKGGLALCGSINGFANNATSCLGLAPGGQVSINPNQTATGISLNIDPNGFIGGSAGSGSLIIGQIPTGHATAIGAYLPTAFGNNVEELAIGTSTVRSLDNSGNEVISGKITAASYQETLTTPASSSAPCMPGQFTDDSNYHYVCVAKNHWKRTVLSSF